PDLQSSVSVGMIDPQAQQLMGEGIFPSNRSVLVGVNIAEKYYPVRNLFDLKMILSAHSEIKVIHLHVKEAIVLPTQEGEVHVRNLAGGIALAPHTRVYTMPLKDVITGTQFSANKFKKNFRFDLAGYETRNWLDAVKKRSLSEEARASARQYCNTVLT